MNNKAFSVDPEDEINKQTAAWTNDETNKKQKIMGKAKETLQWPQSVAVPNLYWLQQQNLDFIYFDTSYSLELLLITFSPLNNSLLRV